MEWVAISFSRGCSQPRDRTALHADALLSEPPGKSRCFFIASLKRIISPKCFKFNWETNHNCIKAIHLSLHKNFFGKHLCINLTSEVATLASWMTLRIQSCKRRGVFATVLVSVFRMVQWHHWWSLNLTGDCSISTDLQLRQNNNN